VSIIPGNDEEEFSGWAVLFMAWRKGDQPILLILVMSMV
jgi:hypothetical protein